MRSLSEYVAARAAGSSATPTATTPAPSPPPTRRHPPRVLYADLDGTLTRDGSLFLGNEGPTLAAARSLVALREAGVEVVPASGRTVAQLREFARAIGATTFIAELGTVVAYDGGARTVSASPRPEWSSRTRIEASGAADLLFERFPDVEFHTPWNDRRDHTVLLRGHLDVDAARDLLADRHPGLTVIDNGPIEDGLHAYHVLPEGVDKGRAVAVDRKERGLAREDCVAVGDSVGDLAFAREVGACFLLGHDVSDRGPADVYAVPLRYAEGFEQVTDALLAGR